MEVSGWLVIQGEKKYNTWRGKIVAARKSKPDTAANQRLLSKLAWIFRTRSLNGLSWKPTSLCLMIS